MTHASPAPAAGAIRRPVLAVLVGAALIVAAVAFAMAVSNRGRAAIDADDGPPAALGQAGWQVAQRDGWLIAIPDGWTFASGACDNDLLVAFDTRSGDDPTCAPESVGVIVDPDVDGDQRGPGDGSNSSGFYPGVNVANAELITPSDHRPQPATTVEVVASTAMTRAALIDDTRWRAGMAPQPDEYDSPRSRVAGNVPLPAILPSGFQFLPPLGPIPAAGEPAQVRAGLFSPIGWTRAVRYCASPVSTTFEKCPRPSDVDSASTIRRVGDLVWRCGDGACALESTLDGWNVSITSEAGVFSEREINLLLNLSAD